MTLMGQFISLLTFLKIILNQSKQHYKLLVIFEIIIMCHFGFGVVLGNMADKLLIPC